MSTAICVLALVVAGTMVGVELCVGFIVNAIFERLPDNAGLLGRADGARVLGAVMPFWYVASLGLSVAVAVTQWNEPRAGWAIVAAVLFAASVLLSVLVLVPINNRSKSWTPQSAPEDWREQLHRWDGWHYLRMVMIVAGLVALATATVR
ncbi:putative membrane protein [Branchiibius hedensis]|uniref:Uncharacterized membrane protein n=1 Tax=Branchiibius hedensis TaxID=672460 RepID=A0A2Y8ZRY3_9MICO|nr:DUF1772 domain-containing protein [Branchiibius hedensis]PWJ24252.1 putative membrane protein [Branchiibius hedensis]SSA33069.1 Uncharacterized membrane protein [Branchiibius hedensis]